MRKIIDFPKFNIPDPWRHGEPDLADLMADPMVALVWRRDGLTADQVWPLVNDVRDRLAKLSRGEAAA